jgi:hypothetical protein
MIYIAAAPVHSDGYSFAIGLYTYGHVIASSKYLLPMHCCWQLTFSFSIRGDWAHLAANTHDCLER